MNVTRLGGGDTCFQGEAQSESARRRKRELITKTLAEDYPGLDYLGIHGVLKAKNRRYQLLWFTVVCVCLAIGLTAIFRVIREYARGKSATLITVKSVDRLLLPELTVCPSSPATLNASLIESELFNAHGISNYSSSDVVDFAYFMLAGSGFQKMKSVKGFTATQIDHFNYLYDTFRGNRTVEKFFYYFFDAFGLKCESFFKDCYLSGVRIDCCSVFVPEYLIRRGRCFKSLQLFQTLFDELGQLQVELREPHRLEGSGNDSDLRIFLTEHKPQIAPFPKYYVYTRTWSKMRITAKWISLFPAPDVCSAARSHASKDVCYITEWLKESVERPFNCTYPYMGQIRETGLESCPPSVLASNYESAVEGAKYTMEGCVISCTRWDYAISQERINLALNYTYRIDVSFADLQFEEIVEVSTLSFMGLMAQIGGQASLFLGCSILNLIQLTIMATVLVRRSLKKRRVVGAADERDERGERG